MTAAEFLAESERIEEAATPGPWQTGEHDPGGGFSYIVAESRYVTAGANFVEEADLLTPDAAFIAHARTALPRMREALDAVLALHRPVYRSAVTSTGKAELPKPGCVLCRVASPCSTVRAIESALAENGGEK